MGIFTNAVLNRYMASSIIIYEWQYEVFRLGRMYDGDNNTTLMVRRRDK